MFCGSLDNATTYQMQTAVYTFFKEAKEKVSLVEIYGNGGPLLMRHIRRGHHFMGKAIADPREENLKKFKAPYIPYVFCYDKKHKLKVFTPYKGMAGTIKILKDFLGSLDGGSGETGGK